MSSPEEPSPQDTFSFVDKRRVSDESSAEEPTEHNSAADDPSNHADNNVEEEPVANVYDVAAYCLGLLITEGFQRIGLIADPRTGKIVQDLPGARVAIDCVAALVAVLDEPGSTLAEPVKREMKRTLNDLRLNYIDRTRS